MLEALEGRCLLSHGGPITANNDGEMNGEHPDVASIYVRANTTFTLAETAGVLSNDIDHEPGPAPLSAVLVNGPPVGTLLAFKATGGFTYRPPPGFTGSVSFTYQATDGVNFSNVATVTLTVVDNPAPTLTGDALPLGAAWPKFHQNVENQGKNGVDILTPVLAWTHDSHGQVWGSPTLSGDGATVYIGSDGGVRALRAADGTLLWSRPELGDVRGAPVVGTQGRIYVGSLVGGLYALDALTGATVWTFGTGPASAPVHSSPTITPTTGWIYFGSNEGQYPGSSHGRVYALDTTGRLVWETLVAGPVWGAPAFDLGLNSIYVGSFNGTNSLQGHFYRLDADTGEVLAETTTPMRVQASPVLFDIADITYVAYASYNGTVHAINAESFAPLWTRQLPGVVHSSPAYDLDGTGYIFIGDESGHLTALDAATGDVIWQFNPGTGGVFSSPAIAGALVYFTTFGGYVYAVNTATGAPAWSFHYQENVHVSAFVWSSPAIGDDGTIYVGGFDGYVYAIRDALPPDPVPEEPPDPPGAPLLGGAQFWVSAGAAQELTKSGATTPSALVADPGRFASDLLALHTWQQAQANAVRPQAPALVVTWRPQAAKPTQIVWLTPGRYLEGTSRDFTVSTAFAPANLSEQAALDWFWSKVWTQADLLNALFSGDPAKQRWRLADWLVLVR
jgi:outer membrane protein assembly factor BamB